MSSSHQGSPRRARGVAKRRHRLGKGAAQLSIHHEEEVVTEKRAVPKERVRMDKQTVTEDQTVSEQIRKEQIESEGAGSERRGKRNRK